MGSEQFDMRNIAQFEDHPQLEDEEERAEAREHSCL